MAFVEPISLDEINDVLTAAFGARLRWQMDASEYDARLDDATHAVAAVLNREYLEPDLTDSEREEARAARRAALEEVPC